MGPTQTQSALLRQQSRPRLVPDTGGDPQYFKEGSPKCGAWLRVSLLSSKGHTDHGITNVSMTSCKHSGPKGNQHILVNLRSHIIGTLTILPTCWKYRTTAESQSCSWLRLPGEKRPQPLYSLLLIEQLLCPRPLTHSISHPL